MFCSRLSCRIGRCWVALNHCRNSVARCDFLSICLAVDNLILILLHYHILDALKWHFAMALGTESREKANRLLPGG
jgi:hypothetical protein